MFLSEAMSNNRISNVRCTSDRFKSQRIELWTSAVQETVSRQIYVMEQNCRKCAGQRENEGGEDSRKGELLKSGELKEDGTTCAKSWIAGEKLDRWYLVSGDAGLGRPVLY